MSTKAFAKSGKVTIDELAGMTKRRFDELEGQIEYRLDLVDKRLDGLSREVKDLRREIKGLTTEIRAGFASIKSAQ